jgi:acetoin utilization protein AcuB
MLVRDRMSAPPVTVDVNSPIREARAIMRHFDIRRVPVLRRGHLTGILSWTDLMRAETSPASTPRPWEVPGLLLKARVHEIMTPDPITIEADSPIERAALIMRAQKIGGLPVVDQHGLCGIITESDIFDAFVDLTGMRGGGTRLLLDVTGKPASLCEIATVLERVGVTLTSIATYEQDGHQFAILRAKGTPALHLAEVLRDKGYHVLHSDDRWRDGVPTFPPRTSPSGAVLPS